jgi:Tfp pilus assembly protein PilX
MKIKKYKKSEKGFVIVLAILILLVMSLMGTTLVVIASNDHKGNTLRDYNQQTFYAAETGIQEAKEYLNQQVQKGVKFKPYDLGPLNFCKTSFFPSLSDNMSYVKAIGPNGSSARKGWASLSHLDSNSDTTEKKRLAKYQYEWFITQSPDANGNTIGSNLPKRGQVSSTSSSDTGISEGTSYKQSSSSTTEAYYFTIFSCGKGENDIIVPIEAVVLVPQ